MNLIRYASLTASCELFAALRRAGEALDAAEFRERLPEAAIVDRAVWRASRRGRKRRRAAA